METTKLEARIDAAWSDVLAMYARAGEARERGDRAKELDRVDMLVTRLQRYREALRDYLDAAKEGAQEP